jgi:hypothetical protein
MLIQGTMFRTTPQVLWNKQMKKKWKMKTKRNIPFENQKLKNTKM